MQDKKGKTADRGEIVEMGIGNSSKIQEEKCWQEKV